MAIVDERHRAIYLVPRFTLHPVSVDGSFPDPSVEVSKKLTRYLKHKYKYKVLVKSGDSWESPKTARLCMQVLGSNERCMVKLENGSYQDVDSSGLR